jgi:hypothetical protein
MPEVHVTFEDGTETTLFSYYPDELTFTPEDFVGLTEQEALGLKHQRDVAFLRS